MGQDFMDIQQTTPHCGDTSGIISRFITENCIFTLHCRENKVLAGSREESQSLYIKCSR